MYQNGMRVISVKVPIKMVEIIDLFVEAGLYSTRSEFVREALRLLIQMVINKNRDIIGEIIDRKALSLILGQITTL